MIHINSLLNTKLVEAVYYFPGSVEAPGLGKNFDAASAPAAPASAPSLLYYIARQNF
jgi:hypothetical protein